MTSHAVAQQPSLSSVSSSSGAPRVRSLVRRALATAADPAATLARLSLGALIFPHGAQHALGWFGGYGFSGTHGWMTKTLGFPAPLAALAILTELVAPIALLAGLAGRAAALGIIGIMLGAISTHTPNGFFMNWFGNQAGEGYEYHLLVLGMVAALLAGGGGRASVDRAISRALGSPS